MAGTRCGSRAFPKKDPAEWNCVISVDSPSRLRREGTQLFNLQSFHVLCFRFWELAGLKRKVTARRQPLVEQGICLQLQTRALGGEIKIGSRMETAMTPAMICRPLP